MGALLTMHSTVAAAHFSVIESAMVDTDRRSAIRDLRSTPATKPDWAPLLRRLAAGDQGAMAELYDGTSHLVFGLAVRILGDRDTAEDAVVEVYSQVWRRAAEYDAGRGTVCTWLLTLARSRAIDMLRSRRHERDADPLEAAGEIAADTPDPESAATAVERQRFVRTAMSSLSHDQREAIELAYFSGLSHTQIAARLGQPLGTIKTRIRLGMTRLREALGHLESAACMVSEDES